jgi:hypothetical protein
MSKQVTETPAVSSFASHDRQQAIIELLESLQALPEDMGEVKVALHRLEQDNQLWYAVLKQHGWLLKDQLKRMKRLEAS